MPLSTTDLLVAFTAHSAYQGRPSGHILDLMLVIIQFSSTFSLIFLYSKSTDQKTDQALACLTLALWNSLVPFYKTNQREINLEFFFLTKIELSCFSFPSTGSFICCLSVLRSLVRGQVVFIIWKKHEDITALPSREKMCNVGTIWISSFSTNVDPCFMRASRFAINYLSNSRKLLACVGIICVRTLAQSRT